MKSNTANEKSSLRHIALIMDGNGRWAKKRMLPRSAGHKEGLKTLEMVTKVAKEQGIPFLSYFAFSTENWNRPKQEVDSLMELLKTRLPELSKKINNEGGKLIFSGDLSAFDNELQDIILQAKILTQNNKGGTINICLNYGGRQEILRAVNLAVKAGNSVTEHEFRNLLFNKELPDPDLLIRTGGEKRLSNFLLYQLAYTELYFTDVLWPDFTEKDFLAAIEEYYNRNRRYGRI